MAVLLTLVLAACGGDNDSAGDSTSAADSADDSGAESAMTFVEAPAAAEAAMEDSDSMEMETSDGDGDAGGAAFDRDEVADQLGEADTDAVAEPDSGAVQVPTALQPIDIGRDIVFTAAMELEADDVGLAAEQALQAVAPLGGLLFGQSTVTRPEPRTVLTIKVLPKDFQQALGLIGGVGEIKNQDVSSTDVTERVVDLRSQISTAETSVRRLQELLAGSANLDDIAQLEQQLLERETRLELLRGQLRTVQDQVGLATIVVTITETKPPALSPELELTQTLAIGFDEGRNCPGDEDELEADEGEELTICYQVTNVGDATVTDITISDPPFDIRHRDLVVMGGGENGPLAPGATRSFHGEYEVGRFTINSDARVNAVALRDDLEPAAEQVSVARTSVRLRAVPNNALPGFVDSLSAGWDILKVLFGILVVILGLMIPFLPFIALAIWGLWLLRRRRAAKRQAAQEARDAQRPADPPPPTADSV